MDASHCTMGISVCDGSCRRQETQEPVITWRDREDMQDLAASVDQVCRLLES